ncbi:hypothetical protein [Halodesulfovibrio aestuarii]|uniref:hypothetical protein n=1 Tax=Halodesulfovibrio aestuarii TaxID=126333 RepID=UPI000413B393
MSDKKDTPFICFPCHGVPLCVSEYKIAGLPNAQTINYPNESKLFEAVTILSDSTGEILTSTLVPKGTCSNGKADCPKTVIKKKRHFHRDDVVAELSPAKLSETYTVSYDPEKLLKPLGVWEWLKQALDTDASKIPSQEYISTTSDCSGVVQTTTIDVFPELIYEGNLTIGSIINAETESEIKKRYKYEEKEAVELQKLAKKKKWSKVGKYVSEKEFTVKFTGTTFVGHEFKKYPVTLLNKKGADFRNKNSPVHKVTRILQQLGTKAMGNNSNAFIKKITLIPPQLSISGKKELKIYKNALCYDYKYSLNVDPLLGIVVILDVIDVLLSLLASPGAGIAWRNLRERLEEMKKHTEEDQKKFGWYGIFYIDLVISGKILQGEASLVSTNHVRSLEGKVGNEFGLQIKAGVEAGAKLLLVSGQLLLSAETYTAIKSNLVFDKKGVGVEFAHDGIRSHFSIRAKAEVATEASPMIETTERKITAKTKAEEGYEVLTADVVWVKKDTFGPYYFIDG